jgi:hypothetical protein
MNGHEVVGHVVVLMVAGFGVFYSFYSLARLVLSVFRKPNEFT